MQRVQQHSPFYALQAYNMSFVRETTNVYSSSFYFLLNIYILQLDWPVNGYASLGGPNILDDVVRGDILSNSCFHSAKWKVNTTNQRLISVCGSVKENISNALECVSSHFWIIQSLLKIVRFDILYSPLVSLFRMWWNTLSSFIYH